MHKLYTETWLSEAIPNEIIGLCNYDIIDSTELGKKEAELLFMFTEIYHIEFDVTYHLVNLNVFG
jgi:hypothetical protein